MIVLTILRILGQIFGFYGVICENVNATNMFSSFVAIQFGFSVVRIFITASVFWISAVWDFLGLFVILLYFVELRKSRQALSGDTVLA